jgi:NADPH2:quinone reductase
MKAIVMSQPGGPEVLRLQELPVPVVTRDTDILVRLKAIGLNPVDIKMRAKPSGYPAPLPPVLGCDGAGIVEAVGKGVTDFKPGDEVYYCQPPHHDRHGSYAQHALVDSRLAARKPMTMSFTEAAAAPLVLITAWESLHDRASIKPGDKVLVHAGAGGVGHVAVQLARIAGAEVATTVSSKMKAEFVRPLGVHRTILYKQEKFAETVLAWTAGAGADIALDTVGGATLAETFAAVRVYGDVVTLLAPGPEVNWSVPRVRNQRFSFELMLVPAFFEMGDAMAHQGEILRRCAELIDTGKLHVLVDATLPLEQVPTAHALLESGRTKGKIVLTVD